MLSFIKVSPRKPVPIIPDNGADEKSDGNLVGQKSNSDGSPRAANPDLGDIEEKPVTPAVKTKKKIGNSTSKSKQRMYSEPPKNETEALQRAMIEVEDRFKERELTKIKIYSILVENLIPVHKFVKNTPWLKCSVVDQKWSVDSDVNGESDGRTAEWKNLNWSFILPRNEQDRTDLVVTVCSQEVIIGRYILLATEFAEIPDTSTGYFEISGEVLNALGKAGDVRIVCKKSAAERPSRPKVDDPTDIYATIGAKIVPGHVAIDAPTNAVETNETKNINKLYVKFGSISLADLKSAHTFELNSPYVTVTRNRWKKSTPIIVSGGSTAKWNKLRWKIALNRGDLLNFEVLSASVPVGRAVVSFDDVLQNYTEGKVVLDFVRHLSDGSGISGRMKVKIQVFAGESKDDDMIGIDLNGNDDIMNNDNDVGNGAGAQDEGDDDEDANVKIRVKEKARRSIGEISPNPKFSASGMGLNISNVNNTSATSDNLDADVNEALVAQVLSSLNVGPTESRYALRESVVNISKVPFTVQILAINAIDLKAKHMIIPNSPHVNVACGSWGAVTPVIQEAGPHAQWINLQWSCPIVTNNNKLRFIVWSRNEIIGSCFLKVEELLATPLDYEGYTEYYLKITDDWNRVTGKLKVTCRYDQMKHAAEKYNRLYDNIQHTVFHGDKDTREALVQRLNIPALEFPLLATVKSISCMDLRRVHAFVNNSPQVKIICDRKSAYTRVQNQAGGAARWTGMNWQMPVHEGSFVMIAVASRDVQIGRLELASSSLINTPINPQGLTEINQTLVDNEGHATGKMQIVLKLDKLPDNFDFHSNENSQMFRFEAEATPKTSSKPGTSNSGPSLVTLGQGVQRPSSAYLRENSIGHVHFDRLHGGTTTAGEVGSLSELQKRAIALQLRVIDIDIYELKSAHSMKKNSPYISLACGRYMETSKEIIGAGSSAFWSNLMWSFPIQAMSSVRITVGSHSITIGIATLSPERLLSSQADVHGLYRIVETIYDGMQVTGKLKMTFEMTVSKDRKELLKQRRGRPSSAGGRPERPLSAADRLGSPSQSNLVDSNNFLQSALSPIRRIQGDRGVRDENFDDSDDERFEEDVQIRVANKNSSMNKGNPSELMEEDHNVIDAEDEFDLTFPLNSTLLKISLSDIYIDPRTVKSMISHLAASSEIDDSAVTGNARSMRVKMQCGKNSVATHAMPLAKDITLFEKLFSVLLIPSLHSEVFVSVYMTQPSLFGADKGEKLLGCCSFTAEQLVDIPRNNVGVTEMTKSLSTGKYCTGMIQISMKLEPCLMPPPLTKEPSVPVIEESTPAPQDNGIPMIKFDVVANPETFEKNLASKPVKWTPINAPPLPSRLTTNVATTGANNPLGQQTISGVNVNGVNSAMVGATMPSTSGDAEGAVAHHAQKPIDLLHLTTPSQPYINGFRVKVKKFSAIKMKPMHKLVKNCPLVTFVCGNTMATTPIIPGAGSTAAWDNLDLTFVVHFDLDVKVTVSSKAIIIGGLHWSLTDLLRAKGEKDDHYGDMSGRERVEGNNFAKRMHLSGDSELLTIFGDLLNERGDSTGSVKMVYKLSPVM